MPPLNTMMPSINDKSVLNMLPNFDDPVEQSLASLEQSLACKLSKKNIDRLSDKLRANTSINQMILGHVLGYDNPHHNNHDNNGNNGFSMDSTLNTLNGMTNVPSSVPNNNMLMGLPSLTQTPLPPVTSMVTSDHASDSISTSDQRGIIHILFFSVQIHLKILFR